jgi:hypothetical protein
MYTVFRSLLGEFSCEWLQAAPSLLPLLLTKPGMAQGSLLPGPGTRQGNCTPGSRLEAPSREPP